MISVCLPTYCRFDMTMDAIKSLYNTCIDKRNFEVIIRFDENDTDSLSRLNELPDEDNCRYIVSDHKFGYKSLHEFQNELALRAHGGWILFWNDDVKMLTQGWDILTMSAAKADEPAVIQISTGSQFPTITRRLYQILGHVSLHTAYDDYLNYIGQQCGIVRTNHCFVDHEYHKGDKVGDDNNECSLYVRHTFHSEGNYQLIDMAVSRVRKYIDDHKKKEVVPTPTSGVRTNVQPVQQVP